MKKRKLLIGVVCLLVLVCFYTACMHYTGPYEVGIAWNFITGNLWLDDVAGFNVTPPWVLVARIDTRPVRVCITSSASAALNCRLVQFKPSAWEEFVEVQGWQYYWLSNRISFNFGYREEYRGVRDLMRGYAFSSKQYPFIEIKTEYEESN